MNSVQLFTKLPFPLLRKLRFLEIRTRETTDELGWVVQGAAFNVTHFEIRITHLLYTATNTTEHGQVSQCLGFTKSLTSSMQRLEDVLHDNQGIADISHIHLP
jgi:hypothetical protein